MMETTKRIFKVDRQDIHYLRTTIESYDGMAVVRTVEPHGQEPVTPSARRNPPKLQSSFAEASEGTRIPPRSGDRGSLRRRVDPGEATIELLIAPGCEDLISRLLAALREKEGIRLEAVGIGGEVKTDGLAKSPLRPSIPQGQRTRCAVTI